MALSVSLRGVGGSGVNRHVMMNIGLRSHLIACVRNLSSGVSAYWAAGALCIGCRFDRLGWVALVCNLAKNVLDLQSFISECHLGPRECRMRVRSYV